MTPRRTTLAALLVALAFAPVVRADIIYSNFGPGDTFSPGGVAVTTTAGGGFNQDIAVPFTVPTGSAFTFTSAEMPMFRVTAAGTLDIQLRADAAGLPGVVLDTITVAVPPTGSAAVVTAVSVANPTLTAGATYWIATNAAGTYSGGWLFPPAGSPTSIPPGGRFAVSGDGAEMWGEVTANVPMLRVNADPDPAPSAVPAPAGVVLFGVAGLGLLARRRRAG